MGFGTRSVTLLGLSLAALACGPTKQDGIRAVFASSQLCPTGGITLKERPDLAPHTVLKDVTPPPGVAVDSLGDTYEVSGCGTKQILVCGHPVVGSHADPFSAVVSPDGNDMFFNTSRFALFTAHSVEGGRITSAVVCQGSSQSLQ
jgi:hypothetical protein